MPEGLFAILNPTAGSGRAGRMLDGIVELWRDGGVDVEVASTRAAGHASQLAEDAARAGWPAVVAIGGDGTVHEVASGLFRAADPGPTVPLGVVPAGSGNDFATALGSARDPLEAARLLPLAEARRVDGGRVDDGWFVNGVGVGFDARVAARARTIPWLRGTALYAVALLRELATHGTLDVRVVLDGTEVAGTPVVLVTASNGPSHGGGFHLCPDARLDDGRLDLLVAGAMSRRRLLRFLLRSLDGAHGDLPEIDLRRGRRVEISSASPLPVHVDGEILRRGGVRELSIEILPGRLTVLAGAPGRGLRGLRGPGRRSTAQ